MNNEEIAQAISQGLQGGKLVSVVANQGPVPSFTLLFENGNEEQGTLTFQPSLLVESTLGQVGVKAQININVGAYHK